MFSDEIVKLQSKKNAEVQKRIWVGKKQIGEGTVQQTNNLLF